MNEDQEYIGCFNNTWDFLTDIWCKFRQSITTLGENERECSETLREIADILIEEKDIDNDDNNNNNDDIELEGSPDIIIDLDDDLTISKIYIRYYADTPFILLSYNKNNIEPVQEILDNWFEYREDSNVWYYLSRNELFISLSEYYETYKGKNIDWRVVLNSVRKIKFFRHNGKMVPCGYRFKK